MVASSRKLVQVLYTNTLRKHVHAIYRDFFSAVKIENFSRFFFYIFLIFAQNIDCGYTLEPPNEYPQSMFWNKNKKNRYTPAFSSYSIRGIIKNYVDFSHNLTTILANIFKFQLSIN